MLGKALGALPKTDLGIRVRVFRTCMGGGGLIGIGDLQLTSVVRED